MSHQDHIDFPIPPMPPPEPVAQKYNVTVWYEEFTYNYRIDGIIDWKLENDVYYFFQPIEGQARMSLSTQWLKAPGLIRVVITPTGTSVPYPSQPQ